MDQNVISRKNVIENCRRIVVKAGTRLLTSEEQIAKLVGEIAFLRKNPFFLRKNRRVKEFLPGACPCKNDLIGMANLQKLPIS